MSTETNTRGARKLRNGDDARQDAVRFAEGPKGQYPKVGYGCLDETVHGGDFEPGDEIRHFGDYAVGARPAKVQILFVADGADAALVGAEVCNLVLRYAGMPIEQTFRAECGTCVLDGVEKAFGLTLDAVFVQLDAVDGEIRGDIASVYFCFEIYGIAKIHDADEFAFGKSCFAKGVHDPL